MKRQFVLAVAALICLAIKSQAATLEVRLIFAPVINSPGEWYNIIVQAKTDTKQLATGSGGISGFQFDIISSLSDKSAPISAGSGPLANKVKTTWDPTVASNFSLITPARIDATPAGGYPLDTDTDLDAVGGSFSDANNFSKTDLGVDGYVTIATEQWELFPVAVGTPREIFSISIIGPQWYDFVNGTGPAFRGNYDVVLTHDLLIQRIGPEPTSSVLIGLGLTGFLRCRRRRA